MQRYNAFFSYNNKDQAYVEKIYNKLKDLEIFFDKKETLGKVSQDLDTALKASDTLVVFVGPAGIGSYQKKEIRNAEALIDAIGMEFHIVIIFIDNGKNFIKEIPTFLLTYKLLYISSDEISKAEKIQEIKEHILIENHYNPNFPLERPIRRLEYEGLLNNTIKYYNENAEKYNDHWSHRLPNSLYYFLEKLKMNGIKKGTILDAGCGPGHHTEIIAKYHHHAIGIDLAEKAISIANSRNNSNLTFKKMDMRDIHEEYHNEFDAIWACASCVHLHKGYILKQLSNFYRTLKPGGIIGISLQVDGLTQLRSQTEDQRFFESFDSDAVKEWFFKHTDYLPDKYSKNKEQYDYWLETTFDSTTNENKTKKWLTVFAQVPNTKPCIKAC